MRGRLRRIISVTVVTLALVLWPYQLALAEDIAVSVGVGDTSTLIQGSTSPLAQVTFMDGASVIGTTTADTNGDFSQVFTNQTPGLHTYQLFSLDTNGRVTDTVAVSVSVQEHQQTPVTVFLPPTIALSDNEVVQGEPIEIIGMTVPNAEVVLYVDQGYVIVTSDALGNWQHTLMTRNLDPGEHQLYAVAVKSGGVQSYPTGLRTIIIQPKPGDGGGPPVIPPPTSPPTPTPEPSPSPTPTPLPTPGRPRAPVITSPRSGTKIEAGWINVCGTAEPGTQIEIWNRGQLIGSVFADSHGKWCVRLYLGEFSNELKVRACRRHVCSAFSGSLKLFREAPAQSKSLALSLNKYRLLAYAHDPVTIIARISGGNKPYHLVVNWGDGESTSLSRSNSPQLLTHRYSKAGAYNGTATVTDAEGKLTRVYFSVEVLDRPGALSSWVTTLLAPAVIVATAGVSTAVFFPKGWRWVWRGLRRVVKR